MMISMAQCKLKIASIYLRKELTYQNPKNPPNPGTQETGLPGNPRPPGGTRPQSAIFQDLTNLALQAHANPSRRAKLLLNGNL
jgi:hypothetical protein